MVVVVAGGAVDGVVPIVAVYVVVVVVICGVSVVDVPLLLPFSVLLLS